MKLVETETENKNFVKVLTSTNYIVKIFTKLRPTIIPHFCFLVKGFLAEIEKILCE